MIVKKLYGKISNGAGIKSNYQMKFNKFLPIIPVMILCIACPVPENEIIEKPVQSIEILINRQTVPDRKFTLLEGRAFILSAQLMPDGVLGGVHWQESRRRIVELSAFTGPEISLTGMNGGRTIISVLARNTFNEAPVENEITFTVIPKSFFKWNYHADGLIWEIIEPDTSSIMGRAQEILIRSGETPIINDRERGGLILEGPRARLLLGSVMTSPTNSGFIDDPVHDTGGEFDFLNGPAYKDESQTIYYPFYNKKILISVDYEVLIPSNQGLRIQVNNNTGENTNASAIDNWLVLELNESNIKGTATTVFNSEASRLVKGGPGLTVETVLSNSFICLWLPDGKILIRGIRIESAD